MPSSYKYPGVYIEEISFLPASVAPVETAIPVFMGATQKASEDNGASLLNKPTRISGLLDYEAKFGKAYSEEASIIVIIEDTPDPIDSDKVASRIINVNVNHAGLSGYRMYDALQLFFVNGGGDCYIVSVANYDAGTTPLMYNINKLKGAIDIIEEEDEPTLLLFTDRFTTAAYKEVYDYALTSCAKLMDRFCIMDIWDETNNPVKDAGNFREKGIGMNNLSYGAVYYPMLKTNLSYCYDESKLSLVHKKKNSSGNAFSNGIYDGKKLIDIKFGTNGAVKDINLYKLIIQKINETGVIMNPSPAIAGVYNRIDRERGVWKAPANVGLKKVIGPCRNLTNTQLDYLNVDVDAGKSINIIRYFEGKGTLIWGARTLAGNNNEWRYVSVRRFFIFVEESLKKANSFAVFEPNEANVWLRVKGMIENFLFHLWKQGALQGTKPEEAYFVKVGLGLTMTTQDILEGRMNIEIGMAVLRPAEFIILMFSHKMQV